MSEGGPVAHGCLLLDPLHQGPRSSVYRCRRLADGAPVVMKLPSAGSVGAQRTQALIDERDLLRGLATCNAVIGLVGFDVEDNQPCLLLDDFGGMALDRLGLGGKLAPTAWLELARRLTHLLVELHRDGVVHNDVNASNIVLDGSRRTAKLIDFASARRLDASAPPSSIRLLDGPVAYMSPERTGRLNRPLGPRSDLYSLGVVLFELITGRLPFQYGDPREIVHAHLAREAPRVSDLVAAAPSSFSNIIQKLLAKEPEARYQSASELETDFERLASNGAASVAAVKASTGFRRRTLGQERVISQLIRAQDAAHDRARAAVLVGEAGSGKSTLALGFAEHAARAGGLFAMGRCARTSSGLPHEALSQVLVSLAQQLLSEGEARLGVWKNELALSLGGTRDVLLEFCPALAHLLPPADARPAEVLQTRNQLAPAIITLFEHAAALKVMRPCVFFDDIQFASGDALKLLLDIVAGCRRVPILFLFACRPDDTAGASARDFVARLDDAGLPVERIEVPPLTVEDVAAFIRDAVPDAEVDTAPLASVVVARTHGNPFFVRAFLDALRVEGLLGREYDLERINRLGVTANVAQLLIDSLARLPERVREVLEVGACAGSVFDEDLVETCIGARIGAALAEAVASQLVLPVAEEDLGAPGSGTFRRVSFVHDLVRNAVLWRLPAAQKLELHWRLGRALLERHDPERLGDGVFEVTRHLNEARVLIEEPDARAELAGFNLLAARAALGRAAASEAASFARTGVELLPGDAWQTRYELTRELHVVGCEAAFECANHETLSELASPLLAHAKTAIEASRTYWLKGRVLQARSRSTEAIGTFLTALSALGVDLDANPTPSQILAERSHTFELLARHSPDALSRVPRCRDEASLLASEFLSKLIFFAYSDMSSILPLVICRLVRLTLEQGSSPESANGFTFYGLLLALEGDRQGAFAYAKVALSLAREIGDPTNLSQTYLYTSYLLLHWKMPCVDLVEPLGDAYRYGLASGSPLNTACSATTLSITRFWAGHELTRLAADMEEYRKVITRFRQERILNWHEIWMQTIENLRTGSSHPSELAGPLYNEAERYPQHLAVNDKTAVFNLNVARTLIAFLFGHYADALRYSERNRRIPLLFACSSWAVPTTFLDGLCLLACSASAAPPERAELLETARHAVGKLATWLPDNPREIEPKLCLLEAELARVTGDVDVARRRYARARELATGSGSPLEEALVSEAAGRFELAAIDRDAARQHLRVAHRAYLRWGAIAKARAVESEFPELFRATLMRGAASSPLAASLVDFDFLDLASWLDASLALTSEIKLDALLERLMKILIETAGAETGCLLMPRDDRWVIEVAQSAEGGTISVLEGLPPGAVVARGIRQPEESIVNYVASTGEAVVLQDEPRTSLIPHTLRGRWRGEGSVLCFAVKRQGRNVAIAYLENGLTRGAFTRGALRVLELLSAQAAVSLENARLYAELEHHVELRTRELSAKKEELEAALQRLTDIQRKLITHEKLSGLATIAGGLAHEIKNPLNFIANFAEGAVETADELVREVEAEIARFRPEKQRTLRLLLGDLRVAVAKVVEHANRANRLVNRMSPQAGGKPEVRETDLNELVLESLSVAMPQTSVIEPEIQIVTDLATSPVKAIVAAQDLVQVIVNLVTNAIDAVAEKRVERGTGYVPQVKVSTRALGDRVELRVFDNGVGVPTLARQDIFVHFFTTKPAGHGLGLSLSREIVVAGHGGSLTLDSVEGEYAEFVVSLPVAAAPALVVSAGLEAGSLKASP